MDEVRRTSAANTEWQHPVPTERRQLTRGGHGFVLEVAGRGAATSALEVRVQGLMPPTQSSGPYIEAVALTEKAGSRIGSPRQRIEPTVIRRTCPSSFFSGRSTHRSPESAPGLELEMSRDRLASRVSSARVSPCAGKQSRKARWRVRDPRGLRV